LDGRLQRTSHANDSNYTYDLEICLAVSSPVCFLIGKNDITVASGKDSYVYTILTNYGL
jgi:hypothetical protein